MSSRWREGNRFLTEVAVEGAQVQSIGRYKVLGELGRGAMGIVYRAEDPNIGRQVALKTTRVDVQGVESDELIKRLKQEARSAGVLNHPNIVTIYDAGEQDGLFYIAMEFIEGETLQSMLSSHLPLPPDQVIEMARQICAGLDYAHQRGIVHRDIKPANIMITPEGTAKVMDFGIAKMGSGMTSAGQVLGTPSYMSPEQVKGKAIDGRSDLFSMGVILYECVTAQKPFTGDNITTIIYKIVNEEPTPPREIEVGVHPGLSRVITKALAKNVEDRYQRGWELARDLVNYKSLATGAESSPEESDKTIALSTTQLNSAALAAMPPQAAAASPALALDHTLPMNAGSAAPAQPAAASKPVPITKPVTPAKPVGAASAKPQSPTGMIVGVGLLTVVLAIAGMFFARSRHKEPVESAATQAPAQPTPSQTLSTAPSTAPTTDAGANSSPAPPTATTEAKPADTGATDKSASDKSAGETSAPKSAVTDKSPAKNTAAPKAPLTKSATAKPKSELATSVPPPAPLVALTGQLRVTTVPAGADVIIDGKPAGSQSPLTLPEIAPGVHTIVMSKAGYRSESRNVEVERGKRAQVQATLVTAMATLTLGSTPPGASVFVDGSDSGKVTPAQLPVAEGSHKITLKMQGYHAAETSVTLRAGDTYSFTPPLKQDAGSKFGFLSKVFRGDPANKGTITIRTRPRGATVLVNGTALPKTTPIVHAPMEPGKYHITVKADGFKPLEKDIVIVKGQDVAIEQPMEKQ